MAVAQAACAAGWTSTPSGDCGLTLGYTGAPVAVSVPLGVDTLQVYAAGGAGAWPKTTGNAVGGGFQGTLSVISGETLTAVVGGAGQPPSGTQGGAGGYGGGGSGGSAGLGEGGGGGGGGSFVFAPDGTLLIAGGGGGGTSYYDQEYGGDGGGYSGGHGCCGLEAMGFDSGQGGTQTAGGAPGSSYTATAGDGPATGLKSFGTGGVGAGSASDFEGGGGGGGGFYGGGGGSDATEYTIDGGGGGSGYVSSVIRNPTTLSGNPNAAGYVSFYYTVTTLISGTIVTPFGDGLAGVTVNLTGTSSATTTTGATGSYSFAVAPGTYTVTPQVPAADLPAGADEFTPTECDGGTEGQVRSAGTADELEGSCENIQLAADQNDQELFLAAYTVTGKVTGVDGKGVQGAAVLFVDTEQGKVQKLSATTNAQGQIVASATASSPGVQLAPGSVVASVDPLNGTSFFAVPSTGTDPGCVADPGNGAWCDVNLDHDRDIAFTACVVPNPDGAPLPAPFNTSSDPIPGAVVKPPLEAVGCWIPQNGSADTATVFTGDQPIRLDGVDVNPSPGTTFTLNTAAGPLVTSDGPAQLLVGGWPLTRSHQITLSYQNGVSSAGGTGVSVGDLGAGTGPLAPNLFGLPISLGTGGPAGYGLPFVESTGQTAINLGAQFALPFDSRSTWNVLEGKFQNLAGDDVPSLGLSGQIIATDRMGVVGQICGSINDWEPFGGKLGELSGLTICYTPSQRLWTGAGMWETPAAVAKVVGDIYATIALQNAASATTGQLQGYKLASVQVQFDHLNTNTFTIAGTVPGGSAKLDTEFKESGLPLGAGFFLQSLGAGYKNNLSTGLLSSFNGTIGVSVGPEFNIAGAAVNLIRLDGKVEIQPPQNPGDDWIYQMAVAGTLGRLTPFELQLGNGAVTYRNDPNTPEGDFTFHLGGALPVVGGVSMDITGQSDVPHGVAFEGTSTIKLFKYVGTNDVLLNASNLISLPPGAPPAVLADCFTTGGGFETGFQIDFVSLTPKLGCNMGDLYHPHLLPAATGSSADAAAVTAHTVRLRLRAELKGTMLAVYGGSAPPRFSLTGPGLSVRTPASDSPDFGSHALIFTDKVANITYVALQAPHGGVYTIQPLPGSTPIASVMQANPLPQAKILTAKVTPDGCSDELRYQLQTATGERELIYAQEGNQRQLVGYLHAGKGTLKVPMLTAIKGRGKLIAYYLRGRAPVDVQPKIATFKNAASNRSERITAVRLTGRTLTWTAACGATSYAVMIKHGRTTTRTTARTTRLTLKVGEPVAVTIEAIAPGETIIATAKRTFKH